MLFLGLIAIWIIGRCYIKCSNVGDITSIDVENDLHVSVAIKYQVTEKQEKFAEPFHWNEVYAEVNNETYHRTLVRELIPKPGTVKASFFVPQPVYISLTTMASRMHRVNKTIIGLIQARVVPTTIYLFISKEPFLLDTGVKEIPNELLCLVAEGYLKIIYTANIGPHRKLIPALKRHWGEDVFIATVDDDMRKDQAYMILYRLLKHYTMAEKKDTIVALRARRIGLCDTPPYRVTKYMTWSLQTAVNRQEMMLMPTGTGGILYKPSYFHKVIFHKSLRYATGTADDLMFRLATMIRRIPVQLGCSVLRQKTHIVRRCPRDEYDRKYDSLYGPYSSELFANMTREVSQDIHREYAAAAAAEIAKKQLQLLQQQQQFQVEGNPTHAQNEHDNAGLEDPVVGVGGDATTTSTTASTTTSTTLYHHQQQQHRRLHTERYHNNNKNNAIQRDDFIDTHIGRQLVTLKYKKIAKKGSENDLFSINQRGGNDLAWKLAMEVLKIWKVLDMETLAVKYIREREPECYSCGSSRERLQHKCALYVCDVPHSIASTTTTATAAIVVDISMNDTTITNIQTDITPTDTAPRPCPWL